MQREVRWERMFPDELNAAFAGRPVVYLPYGLCEPHGPQNALGMDALRPHAACVLAARERGGIVAPPEYWYFHGYGVFAAWACEFVGEAKPWLSCMPPWVLFRNLCYHIRAVDALGFHAAVLFSGHAGPHNPDLERVLAILMEHVSVRVAVLHGNGLDDSGFWDERGGGGHAGRGETSLLWAVEPDCVDVSRVPPADAPGPHFAMGPLAREADRRVGERMTRTIVETLLGMSERLLAEYAEREPRPALTFGDVERIWREEIEPFLPEFASMQDLRPDQSAPPPESQWYANWRVPPL